MLLYSELHLLGVFLYGKCSAWKKRWYGSSWVKNPLVILFPYCWWPIIQAGWRGNWDPYQTMARREGTHARLLSTPHIAGLLEYVTVQTLCPAEQFSDLQETETLSQVGRFCRSLMACNSLLHFLKANELVRTKNETTGSQTNSTGQKQCLYLRQGFLSFFSEPWKIHSWGELWVLKII